MAETQGAELRTTSPKFTIRQFAALLVGSSLGVMFEWYDFFLAAAAAASVWPRIFFPPQFDPAVALAVSVATVGIAYLSRPIGAVIFGHFGDKYGRRNTLVSTLIVMGISSVGTAILPSYSSIGILAVVLVFVLRFVMGIGVGGESGGAFSWIAEARPEAKHRGFWTSWPASMLSVGRMFAVFAFFLASQYAPSNAAYLDWGWRVPFAVGAVMLLMGLVLRVKIMESPMFQQLQAKRSVLKYPAFEVIKEQGGKILKLICIDIYITVIPAFVMLPYSVSYLVKLGVDESFANLSTSLGAGMAFVTILTGAYIADYVGRLRVLRVTSVIVILALFPYFSLLNTLNPLWIIVAQMGLYGVSNLASGCNKVIMTESFATKYRYSGMGVSYHLGAFVAGVLISLILPALLLTYGVVGAWQPIVWISIATVILGLTASFFLKETRGAALE